MVSTGLQLYREPLNDSEIAFLVRKETKEKRLYYKLFRIAMVVSFVLPFLGSWYRAFEGAPNAFSPARYFVTTGILLFMSAGATWVSYRANLQKIQHDIKERTKTIEMARIKQKLHMPQNNTYHFYLYSPTRLSIEVSQDDYFRFLEGDEVSIEYTTYSQYYLGYF